MTIRHEYITIACVFALILCIVEIFLLRSALIHEIAARQKMGADLSQEMSLNNANIRGLYIDYQVVNIRTHDLQTEMQAFRAVLNDFKFFPVMIRDKDLKKIKPK